MAQRVGITERAVMKAATVIVDRDGMPALSLTKVAAVLGIRTPSLYAHVDSLDDLRRRLAMEGVQQLTEELRHATAGTTGRASLEALADTYRSFTQRHPGLYAATLRDPGDDLELRAANQRALDVFMDVLRGFGLPESELMHCYRALWSALHGFNALLATGVMSMPADLTTSYERVVDMFIAFVAPGSVDGKRRARRAPRTS